MKVVLTGGGTAGHVNPALSIASIIKRGRPDAQIDYIGTKDRPEAKLVPKAGYPIHFIEVYGLRRSLSLQNIKTAWKTVTSVNKSKKLLKELKPDLVVGTGGYVCFPVCYAASRLHIPVVLHESNAEPGFAVKMLKNSADIVFVNFEEAGKFLQGSKCQVVHSGMPIDHGFYTDTKESAKARLGIPADKKRVLSFGGSLGASHLNSEVLVLVSEYLSEHPEISFIHAVGSRDYAETYSKFCAAGLDKLENITLTEYIYDMPVQMAAADIVICRSGASTLSELAAMGKASVLIPSPNVTNNQQYKNAKVLADGGAAVIIEDKDLTARRVWEEISAILSDVEKLTNMEECAKKFAVNDTEKIIYDKVIELANKSK